MNLIKKLRTIVLGNVHSVLDAVIDLNSIPMLKQHLRDLESAEKGIAAQVAVIKGRLAILKTDIVSAEQQCVTIETNIERLLGDDDASNDNYAVTLQVELTRTKDRTATKRSDLMQLEKTEASMRDTLVRIKDKRKQALDRLKELENLARTASMKHQAADALDQAKSLSSVDAPSVDNIEQRIRDNSAIAGARLEEALNDPSDRATESAEISAAREAIETRRKRAKAA